MADDNTIQDSEPAAPPQTDEWAACPRSNRRVDTKLSDEVNISLEDRARVWEVRKYCQLKPSLAKYDRSEDAGVKIPGSTGVDAQADAALSALLRCLVYELDAEVAMITLLDDTTQYFIAGASRQSLAVAMVGLESTRWYGCDLILHQGGLCERTVTMHELPAIYEVLDLRANEGTKDLPIVTGAVAHHRHYAGAPIVTVDGLAIGTVFAFSNRPSSGLTQQKRQFLWHTSENVMRHLEQASRALEGSRAIMFSTAVASLLESAVIHMQEFDEDPRRANREAHAMHGHYAPFVLRIYGKAAELLLWAFELDGCRFQELRPLSRTTPSKNGSIVLAERRGRNTTEQSAMAENRVQELASKYPYGAVFHFSNQANEGRFLTASGNSSSLLERGLSDALRQSYPSARQILFMPLWDTHHNRTTAAAFGWSTTFNRVYASSIDLSQLSAFCTSVMAQVRRMESHALDQTKADFLGSISHEMRSPLHGTLAGLELLLGTSCTEEQLDLIHSARTGGNELLDNIDKILQFTEISSISSIDATTDIASAATDSAGEDGEVDLLTLCEQIIAKVNTRTQTINLISPSSTDPNGNRNEIHPVVLALDAIPEESNIRLSNHKKFGIVLENLLTNALKYSGIDCCLRANITIDQDNVTATVTDCGKGISNDFLRNSLYVPFSQANSIDSGTGLGLPLVKRAVDVLKGTIRIESDESLGTMAEAIIPLASLTCATRPVEKPADSRDRLSHVPSPLLAQLFVPPIWASGVYGDKGFRLIDNLYSSLDRNLKGLIPTELTKWESQSELPHVIFVRQGDLSTHRERCGKRYAGVKMILIGGKTKSGRGPVSLLEPSTADTAPVAEILGPLVPSKLEEALEAVFRPGSTSGILEDSTAALTIAEDENASITSTEPSSLDDKPTPSTDAETETTSITYTPNSAPMQPPPEEEQPPQPSRSFRKPRLLLVDDNAINLKLLRMYVQKCGIQNPTTAAGGQEAIDAYDKAVAEGEGFDICFMDLSMPDVDGFQATFTIRQRESQQSGVPRVYIVALTGLVSGKDRAAAFDAGVDDYYTKPAGVKSVRDVLAEWEGL